MVIIIAPYRECRINGNTPQQGQKIHKRSLTVSSKPPVFEQATAIRSNCFHLTLNKSVVSRNATLRNFMGRKSLHGR